MENWKVALVSGAAGAGHWRCSSRGSGRPASLLAGVGLATLASEYPEKFAEVRRGLPGFIERGNNFSRSLPRVGDRLAEAAESRSRILGYEICAEHLRIAGGPASGVTRCPGFCGRRG